MGGLRGTVTTVRIFFRDHLGSAAYVTGPNVRQVYEPFGKAILTATGGKYEFTGKKHHGVTDMHYYGARWYDAEAGRFAGVDPLVANAGNPQDLNAYSYVRNDPVNFTDPTGMCLAATMGKVTCYGTATYTNRRSHGALPPRHIDAIVSTTDLRPDGTTKRRHKEKGGSDLEDGDEGVPTGSTNGSPNPSQSSAEGFSESHAAEPGVQVAGKFDDNVAGVPGRALVKLNNDSINAQIDQKVADLRAQARAGDFDGLDVAAFKVRTIARVHDLGVNRIVSGSVEVVAKPPGTAGFPHAFAPRSFLTPFGSFTTVSNPIFIHSARPIFLPGGRR
jgi:RHS repeat-associated protein